MYLRSTSIIHIASTILSPEHALNKPAQQYPQPISANRSTTHHHHNIHYHHQPPPPPAARLYDHDYMTMIMVTNTN